MCSKMGFVKQPAKLNPYSMEERLVALRVPFMQIHDLPYGGQKLDHGNYC